MSSVKKIIKHRDGSESYVYSYTKQENATYNNYRKRYRKQRKSLKERGYDMNGPMLTKDEYLFAREKLLDEGIKNVNQKIVSEQAYGISRKAAIELRKLVSEKLIDEGLIEEANIIRKISIERLRKEKLEDTDKEIFKDNLSVINEILKGQYPNWAGKDRQKWISENVYGSK